MSDTVVAIVIVFFVVGITVGIVTVVALSVLRPRQPGWPGGRLDYRAHDQPPDPGLDEDGPDDQPRWPGDTGSDLTG